MGSNAPGEIVHARDLGAHRTNLSVDVVYNDTTLVQKDSTVDPGDDGTVAGRTGGGDFVFGEESLRFLEEYRGH